MKLSAIANSIGAAFGGLGQDRANAIRMAQLGKGQEADDFDRMMRLRQAGYGPMADVQAALAQAQGQPLTAGVTGDSAPIGKLTDPATLAREIAANVNRNRGQAREAAAGLQGAFQVPGQQEKWAQLPFEQTPAGIALRKSTALDDRRTANDTQRQVELAKLTAELRAPPAPAAPHTRNVSGGVENWNPTTKKWEPELGPDGKQKQPYRAPSGESGGSSPHVAIRQAVQQARAKYLAGEKDFMGNTTGNLSPLEANKRAMADAVEVYGEAAVRAALGGAVPKSGAPVATPKGAPSVVTPPDAQDRQAMADWAAANPPQPGESREAYRARGLKALGAPQ